MNQQVKFWKKWIELQLEHNLDYMVEHSIKNFHFPGLNYVCFEFSPKQTIRLYIVEPKDDLDTTNVQIHNHLYDSQLLVLKGWIKNTVYRISHTMWQNGIPYHAYHLTSALHPDNKEKQIKLKKLGEYSLYVHSSEILKVGDTHFQKHTEIHNVVNDPKALTAFMVFEFPTVKKHSTLFSRKELGDTIPTPNAYLKYERDELTALVSNLLKDLT
jgi:hypothetical protein